MTAIEQWEKDGGVVVGGTHATLEEALIDPKAWQAVGKVRGWGEMFDYPDRVYEAYDTFFHLMYGGSSIEEALSAITK